ncbi:MAG: universal stress protein [Alphaproteobacteria bacterium]|nr:universal stress protein [Alphaproteobacteria bacterium]
MSIKTILVPVNGVGETSPALEVGLGLARRLEAHLEVLHVALDPRDSVAFLGEGMTGAMIEEIMTVTEREAKERGARASALFEALCARHEAPIAEGGVKPEAGYSAAYLATTGREEEQVALRGRLADLIVVSRPLADDQGPPPTTLEAALRETGRLVLVVPSDPPPEPLPKLPMEFGTCVAIAWNGSVEAGRAITAALPLIAGANRVLVYSVGEDGMPGGTAEEVVRYLAWHGVEAAGETLEASPRTVGTRLLGAAAEAGADLLVMGAYTRSRVRRLIFGGVTREVLEGANIPLLMAH